MKYKSRYSAYSPNFEPLTPYGEMRKRIREDKKQKKVNTYGFLKAPRGLKDLYQVNDEIFREMKELHDKQLMSNDKAGKLNALLQLRKGFEKMQEKAQGFGLNEDTIVEGNSDEEKLKQKIVSDLVSAKSLIVTFEKFGGN